MTQAETILLHLQRGHALTSMTAFRLWGITRCAARIAELRAQGHDIRTDSESNGRSHWAVYRMAGARAA